MYKYSPSRDTFIRGDLLSAYVSADNLPDDLVEVTEDVFREFSRTPEPGKIRVYMDNCLNWTNAPPLSIEQLINIAEQQRLILRLHADSEIPWRQDAVTDSYANENETEELKVWKKYRVLLMRVNLSEAPEIEWPVAPSD